MAKQLQPLFGLEFEMAFTPIVNRGGTAQRSTSACEALIHANPPGIPVLPDAHGSGVFLANGGRLYAECGKPEITTPEVTSPADACRYTRASELILLDFGRELMRRCEGAFQELLFSRSNVCYQQSASWACHESYGITKTPESLIKRHFIPHAVSRIIYTGAGGFDNTSSGARFMISPRVAHLVQPSSSDTQRERGIYNTKNESLAHGDYRRVHVICGEHLSSLRGIWLKMATTAVVMAMAERGMKPIAEVALSDPVLAMRRITFDPSLQATVSTATGDRLTAIQIQRRILERAHDLDRFQAPWFTDCLQLWKTTLDQLEQGPATVARTFDWSIKWHLFRDFLAQHNMTWERWEQWHSWMNRSCRNEDLAHDDVELRGPGGRIRSKALLDLPQIRSKLNEDGLSRDELAAYLDLRAKVFELDRRFGQLGSPGIFNTLDQGGHLDHSAPGVVDIQQAKTEPPADTRAAVRGRIIQQHAAQPDGITCGWQQIRDDRNRRFMDLSDPFCRHADWKEIPARPDRSECDVRRVASVGERMGYRAYFSGRLELAMSGFHVAAQQQSGGSRRRRALTRMLAICYDRQGDVQARNVLADLHGPSAHTQAAIEDHLRVLRHLGLSAPDDLFAWLERWTESNRSPILLRRNCSETLSAIAYGHLCRGELETAETHYAAACRRRRDNRCREMLLRPRLEHAETIRRLGHRDRARQMLDDLMAEYGPLSVDGELDEFAVPLQAKLYFADGDRSAAIELLQSAHDRVRRRNQYLAAVRIALLKARVQGPHSPDDGGEQDQPLLRTAQQAAEMCSVLARCRLFARITEHWTAWCRGESLDDSSDFFWGL